MGGDGICLLEMGCLGGDVIGEIVYCIQGGIMLDKVKDGKVFVDDYQKKYSCFVEIYVVLFYDGMMLIV